MRLSPTRFCTVDGCGDRMLALGLCCKHYHRTRTRRPRKKKSVPSIPCIDCGALVWHGSTRCLPCRGISRRRPTLERFTEKYKVNEETGCWEWTGARSKFGYGNFDQTNAHRKSWLLFRGEIPDNQLVLHHCDNPPCVNPAHLFLGTDQDNVNDKVAKRRHEFGEKHHGAKLTNEQARSIRLDPRPATQIHQSGTYPVSYSSICMIRKGRTWRNV